MTINELMSMSGKIERAANIRNLCVEFRCLTVWFDADEYCAHDSMKEFLVDHCELTEEQADYLIQGDYRFIGAEDLALHCLEGLFFNKSKYISLSRAAVQTSDGAAVAAMKLGIDLDYAASLFVGKYDSFVSFVEERFDELHMEFIPKKYHNYIDYEAVRRDWEAEGTYSYLDGYVFESQ